MKVWPIKDKIVQIMGKSREKEKIERMHREREIARICNLIVHEANIIFSKAEKELSSKINHILRNELK